MSKVQSAIEGAASRFASEVISILRGATLSEIQSLTGKASPAAPAPEPIAHSQPPSRTRARRSRRSAVAPVAAAPVEKPKGRTRRATVKKRSPGEVQRLSDRVIEFLRTHKGEIGVAGIADALKVPTGELGLPLSKLRAEGKIATQGQKRNTLYRLT